MTCLRVAYPLLALVFSASSLSVTASASDLDLSVSKALPKLEQLYLHLHQHPELSYQEKATSQRMAQELKQLGFEVTSNFGGYGVVGIVKNGNGPVVPRP